MIDRSAVLDGIREELDTRGFFKSNSCACRVRDKKVLILTRNGCELIIRLGGRAGRQRPDVHLYDGKVHDQRFFDFDWSSGLTSMQICEIVNYCEELVPKWQGNMKFGSSRKIRINTPKKNSKSRQFKEPQECVKIIEGLRRSAIFAMSRGSHELFHTNIWAWLIERDHAFIEDFFGNKIKGEFESVKREQGNRDLTIWVVDKGKKKAYVVENKFKALPREDQLNDYEQGFKRGEEFGGGLLVSLQPPPGSDNWGWGVLTQEKLMERIEDRVRKSTMFSDIERQIIIEYAEMTRKLAGVLNCYSDELGKNWPSEGAEGRLEDAKLGDIFKKMKAAELVQFIEDQNETTVLRNAVVAVDGHTLIACPSFSNKSGIVDFKITKQKKGEGKNKRKLIDEYGIGIQLQGDQYKRIAYITTAKGISDEELYRRLSDREIQWFDDPKFKDWGTSMGKSFCKYVTKNDIFVYQYIDLKEYSFCDIYKMMAMDLGKVVEMAKHGLLAKTLANS